MVQTAKTSGKVTALTFTKEMVKKASKAVKRLQIQEALDLVKKGVYLF